ncbi:hypothetical protein [Pseudoxanthomonas indica]|uniref:Uncharacterized protein n=1 Tax=Pseudoxanthomonas indica TaxID=428993 RepID=A0A1T5ILV9_9GAMM|nr:hypothetical protein [Pseudoxanthomonas indica]GGD52887.1 hypothetical protein GCM10007235_26360 [Pseudoxanthomonas indica]SKC39943.1 hypothetical protein SAMN06296058_0051 [Pseudoxanthomonas indica]
MQYAIPLDHAGLDLVALEAQLLNFDPAGVVDYDPASARLRISTVVLAIELVFILEQAGHRVPLSHIEHVPSVCCGGCSG